MSENRPSSQTLNKLLAEQSQSIWTLEICYPASASCCCCRGRSSRAGSSATCSSYSISSLLPSVCGLGGRPEWQAGWQEAAGRQLQPAVKQWARAVGRANIIHVIYLGPPPPPRLPLFSCRCWSIPSKSRDCNSKSIGSAGLRLWSQTPPAGPPEANSS